MNARMKTRPAGQLIDAAGLKGFRVGGVEFNASAIERLREKYVFPVHMGTLMDYVDKEIASEDLHFGLHKYTEDLGFWPVGVVDEGEEEDGVQEETEETPQDEGEEQVQEPVQRSGGDKEGVAEILDEEGKVIAESEYTKE